MKFKTKIYLLLFLTALCYIGCDDDLLDQKPIDFVSPDAFATARDLEQALNGAYKSLTMAGIYESNTWPIYTDFMVDNGFMDKTWSGEVEFWDQSHNPNSLYSDRKWTRNYNGILRANTVLTYIDQVKDNDELQRRLKGEALFLRALYYYDLTEFYGDVPFRVKVDGIENKDIPRTGKGVIIDHMLVDLDSAITILPEVYDGSNKGRATKGAAMTLKARYYLNNHRYQEAAKACQDVIDLGIYSLHPDFRELFQLSGENTTQEVIFDIQFITNSGNDNLTGTWWTYFFAWSSYMATANLEHNYYMANGLSIEDPSSGYDSQKPWVNRDPRLENTLVLPFTFNGYDKNGGVKIYDPSAVGASNFTGLRIRKYTDYLETDNDYTHRNSGVNNILMRYADVLLMRAEALVMSGSYVESEVAGLINQVRQRPTVNMPTVESVEGTGLSAEELLEIIKHERRVEFAFEGLRIHDIKRWQEGRAAYSDGMGYKPELLTTASYRLIQHSFDSLLANGLPAEHIDAIKNLKDVKYTSQSAYFNSISNQIGQEDLELYSDLFLKYSYPAYYETYTFRTRQFNENKGYLWPIPIEETSSNLMLGENNPGY
ncbi:RagB/SusD family nutrient uptake outer membrane protein [Marinoscillum luteum]|uniref:RagB/SusD family nutrient uptake outer membrane protein n=1 Tax=Marinoscillum luteum TaxID=861051 RepID=A0ABW7N9I1_9BACT